MDIPFQMRSRISIRGCVRPSVGPSVRPSVCPSVGRSHTSWNPARVTFLARITSSTGENASYAVYTALFIWWRLIALFAIIERSWGGEMLHSCAIMFSTEFLLKEQNRPISKSHGSPSASTRMSNRAKSCSSGGKSAKKVFWQNWFSRWMSVVTLKILMSLSGHHF